MNRIDRLFGIITLLQSKKYVSAECIADKFNISVRTVYRDIKALGEQGVPVSFEQPEGYYIAQGYFLPPVSFTTEQANALLLVESMVSAFTDRSIQIHYSAALGKVKAVLRNGQKEKLENLNDNIRMQIPACMPSDFEYLSVIQGAIGNKQLVQIEYRNLKDEVSKRKIEPIGLVFYALSWHMIGWCQMRCDYRDFKVKRILSLVNMECAFSRSEHMALSDYMKELPVDF